jgi:hypothetical protein
MRKLFDELPPSAACANTRERRLRRPADLGNLSAELTVGRYSKSFRTS